MRSAREAPHGLRLLAGAVALSAMGDFLALIVLALRVHDATGSGLAVSALFATTLVPAVVLAPLAGLVVDRVGGVRVLALASLGRGAVAVGLAFATDLVPILVLSALLSAGATLSQPAEFTLVPALARRERLTEANGLMETARYAGFAAGPLLAGVLTAGGGTRVALLVNAASFVLIAGAALVLGRAGVGGSSPAVGPAGAGHGAGEGVRYLWHDRVLRPVVLAATGALMFIPASLTIDVFYVKDVLHAGDGAYAFVVGAWTVGMVVGAMGVAARVPASALAGRTPTGCPPGLAP